jgi:hypothetical protein
VRFRLEQPDADPAGADTEVRFKVRIPRANIAGGSAEVRSVAAAAATAFQALLRLPALQDFLTDGVGEGPPAAGSGEG